MKNYLFFKLLAILSIFFVSCKKDFTANNHVPRHVTVVDSVDLEEGDSTPIGNNKKQATYYGGDVYDDGDFTDGMFGFPLKISVIGDATNIIHDLETGLIISISGFFAYIPNPTTYGSMYGQSAIRVCTILSSATWGTVNTPLPAIAANCTWNFIILATYNTSQGIFTRTYARSISGYLY
jgi:hypothetical protein